MSETGHIKSKCPHQRLRLLVDILGELAIGNAVKIVPVDAELTSQEVAPLHDLLMCLGLSGVSRARWGAQIQ